MSDTRIIVVVDRDYGVLLRLLPEEVPAWVVDSSKNREIIAELWDSRKRWSQSGILTSFVDKPALTPEGLVLSVLDMIDLHHGAYSQNSPWAVAQIIGARPLPHLVEAMKVLGFSLGCQNRNGIEFLRRTSIKAGSDRL